MSSDIPRLLAKIEKFIDEVSVSEGRDEDGFLDHRFEQQAQDAKLAFDQLKKELTRGQK